MRGMALGEHVSCFPIICAASLPHRRARLNPLEWIFQHSIRDIARRIIDCPTRTGFDWSSDSSSDWNSRSTRAGVVPRIKTFTWDSRARRAMPLRQLRHAAFAQTSAQTEQKGGQRGQGGTGGGKERERGREGIRRRSRETDETVSDWRYHVAQVRAINQDKLMINKLVSALRAVPSHLIVYRISPYKLPAVSRSPP